MSDPAPDWTRQLMAELSDAGLAETHGGLWLDDSASVGAVVTMAGAFVGWVDVAWPQSWKPVDRLEDVVHVPAELGERLVETIEHVRAHREAALRGCRYCGARHVPGHMHSDDVCQSCAEQHLGIVH